jgi:hypothetical protein
MAEANALIALRNYARELTAKFRTLGDAQPEDQLKAPVDGLLTALGGQIGQTIVVNTESRVEDVGRPDLAVASGGLLCGYIELKAPGTGADVRRFRDRNRRQWRKFQALPNLVYTDGNEWALYRGGAAVQRVSLLGDVTIDNGTALDEQNAAAFLRLLRDFLSWQPIVPTSPRRLAEVLAPLCHLLRNDVREALRDPSSALSALAGEWRSYLFPEASDDQFADAYAQTLTYALLLARLSGAELTVTADAEPALRARHRLLAQVLLILAQPPARQEIAVGINLLERTIAHVDPDALDRSGGDPWLYFYEDFLASYDPRLRNQRGVYYTPVEVVKAQVNLVADLLKLRLGKPLAYAEEGVTLLDPATGTGTYPLTALQHGLDVVEAEYGLGERGAAASLMARNFHAFELLVGPYAVAHLRISERVIDAGGALPRDGAHVYLTDTLESPHTTPPGQLPLQARELVDEHRRALAVKRDTPILVCIGNPPYDREQRDPSDDQERRKGGWVRHGEPGEPDDRALLADFLRPARESGAGGHLKNVYNDYVYFWRWALWKVFETKEGPGIVSFITGSSYLRGPGFVGMREVMRRTFDELWIIDLEGATQAPRMTENVFAIETPVAIAIGVRYGAGDPETPADVWYAKLEGTREAKLAELSKIEGFHNLQWSACYTDWQKPFVPMGVGDYFSWPLLTNLFPWQHSGVQVKRAWPIGETEDLLARRWTALLKSRDRATAMRETDARTVQGRYGHVFDPSARLPAVASLTEDAPPLRPQRYSFRSFDRQWILPDTRLIDRIRPSLWSSYSEQQIFLTSLLSEALGAGPAVIVAACVPDLHHYRGSFGGKDVIPLWRDAQATEPNITVGLLDLLTSTYGDVVATEELFAYAYALLADRTYAERFSDELSIPGPRLPLTKDVALFRRSAVLGRELVALHTYGERFADALPGGQLPRGAARSLAGIPFTPEDYPETFSYDGVNQELRVGTGRFGPVTPAVWEYSVSGLQVVRSWLGYRMRDRSGLASSPLDEIRPERWTLAMTRELLELLWVLEATIEREPALCTLLDAVIRGPLFTVDELPNPTPQERDAPAVERSSESAQQVALALEP